MLADALQVAAAYPGGGGHLGWIHWDGHQDDSALQGYSKDLLPLGAQSGCSSIPWFFHQVRML